MKINFFYFRSKNGVYYRPIYTYLSFYVGVSLAVVLISQKILELTSLAIFGRVCDVATFVFIFSLVVLIYFFVVRYRENAKFLDIFDMLSLESRITRDLVDTRNVSRVKDVPYIKVPWVHATFVDNRLRVQIGKIAGLKEDQMDDLREVIDSSLDGRFKNFAISSGLISDDRLYFDFWAEDVATNLTWTPKAVKDLRQKSYMLKLQEGVEIDLSKRPSLGVWGATGFGKSTVVFACIAQLMSYGADLIFLDGKSEYSALSVFYPKDRFFVEADEIENALNRLVKEELPRRQKILDKATRKKHDFGLTGRDIGLKPLVVIADEIGNLAGSSKQRKAIGTALTTIVQRGRAISCFVIWATQDPAVSSSMSVLPQGALSQLTTKILLGSAKPEVQREVFGEVVTKGNVPHFRGYYISNGLTTNPKKFFVPDLYENDLMKIETFEKIYRESKK